MRRARSAGAAGRGPSWPAGGCPSRRATGRSRRDAVATGRRERTKAANRAALVAAARDVFGELGFEAVAVRDIVRRTDLASGTFYNYFADKGRSCARWSRRRAQRRGAASTAPGRVRPTSPGSSRPGTARTSRSSSRTRDVRVPAPQRRHAGTTGLEHVLPLGAAELEEDLGALVERGALPALDLDYWAHAMVAVGVELGARMAEREPPDIEGATRFAAELFLAGLTRASTGGARRVGCRHAQRDARRRATPLLARGRLPGRRHLRPAAAHRVRRDGHRQRRVAARPHGLRRVGPLGRHRARGLRPAGRRLRRATWRSAAPSRGSPGSSAAALPDGARVLCAEGDSRACCSRSWPRSARGVTVELAPLERLPEALGPEHDVVAVSAAQSADGRLADLGALVAAAAAPRDAHVRRHHAGAGLAPARLRAGSTTPRAPATSGC